MLLVGLREVLVTELDSSTCLETDLQVIIDTARPTWIKTARPVVALSRAWRLATPAYIPVPKPVEWLASDIHDI